MTVEVRPGVRADLDAVCDIYAHYVRETHITFDLEPPVLADWEAWFTDAVEPGAHEFLVAVDGGVLGYVKTDPFRPKAAYVTSVYTTIYCDPSATGRGIGGALYADLFARLKGRDLHRAYAAIALPNEPSIALHERFGFGHIGTFREVGRKFDRYWDVANYEKDL